MEVEKNQRKGEMISKRKRRWPRFGFPHSFNQVILKTISQKRGSQPFNTLKTITTLNLDYWIKNKS